MPNYEQKEKYSGNWNGNEVSFTRTFRGKRLTDDECEALLAGETISIMGLVSQKTGNEYGCNVKLDNCEFNGHKFVGVTSVGFTTAGLPKVYCQHEFTDDERTLLEAGQTVFIEGYVSKKGNTFSCNTRYSKEEGIKFEFKN